MTVNIAKIPCIRCISFTDGLSQYGYCLRCEKELREIMDEKQEHKEYLSTIDPVNHPSHYTTGKYEVIDILEDKLSAEEFKGFLKGNILKYVLRAEHKGGMVDYKKAAFYLNKLVGNKNV